MPRVSKNEGRRILEKVEDHILPALFDMAGAYRRMEQCRPQCPAITGLGRALQRLALMHGGVAQSLVYGEPVKDGTQTTFDWQEAA